MSALSYLTNRPDEVLEAVRRGEIIALETAVEELPDLFVMHALDSGLLDNLADSFPDPRKNPEIPMRIVLAAAIAGHFAGLYALSQSPYALHSPQLLAKLGVQVRVNLPGIGLSRRGTREEASFHGDVLRKLLEQIAESDKAEGQWPGQAILDWFNQHVGKFFCEAANAEPTLHILDCTDLVVPLKNDHYEHSGITTKNGVPQRGYKLGTIRSLLDTGAVITGIAWGAIQEHDLTVTKTLVRTSKHLNPADILLHDRGFLDGAGITSMKKERGVDICTGLKRDMVLTRAAVVMANAPPGAWQKHPTRPHQQIQLVKELSGTWSELGVPMNVVVIRWKDKATQEYDYAAFSSTDLSLDARQMILLYQTRPEIEEDYRQLKSTAWKVDCFCTTRLVQIIWHVVLTLLAYNLFQVYANTQRGRQFAEKTKQKLERERKRNPPTYLLVCTHDAFAVFETKSLLYVLLDLPDDVRQKIRKLLPKQHG